MASRLATILVIVIVGATFIAGLIVGAQRDDANGPVDLIIVNGKVYPGGGAGVQEAVAVRGNQILRVGSNRDVKRLRRAQTVVVDAHGGTVVPGLNDTHVQLTSGALALEQLDLSSAATLDDLQARLVEYAEDAPERPWVIGRAASEELLTAPNPNARKILDALIADRPVVLYSERGNVAWANSEALKRASITRHSGTTATVLRDRRTGEPSGVLKAQAIDLMTQVLPQASHAEKILALRAAIDEAHKAGVTSVQSVSTNAEEMDLLREIRQQGDLSLRVAGAIAVSDSIDETAVESLDQLRRRYPDDPRLKLGAAEIVCGCERARLENAVTLLDKHDWHIVVRVSDAADVRAALDAFDRSLAENAAPARGRRYRLENVEAINTEDLQRLSKYHLIVDTLGAAASGAAPTWIALSDAGARLLFGSNWPADTLDPRETLEDIANVRADGPAAEVPAALSLRSVIEAYTGQAAFAAYDEQRKGTLGPGMLADIVILSDDIFQTPQSLKDAAVAVTIFDGKVVYQRPVQPASN